MRNIYKNEQNGRSMVEMLGVLAIIGVLSVGGIAGYSKAMTKFKINKSMDQISMLVANIRTLFSGQRNYSGLSNQNAISFGIIPGEMDGGGAVITNEALKVKTGRDYPQCNPEFALMDPTYTYTVPKKQMVSGSFDILSHIMETYFSEPNEDNVSDDISEALMRSVIKNLRAAIQNPEDYTARSNLMWASTMAENRIIKLGKKCDFECHQMEHQLGAYTDCNHGCGLAVLHPVYYRHIYKDGLPKFVRFAKNVWQISDEGKTEEEIAKAGVEAPADFIKEIGLPTTLRELGMTSEEGLKEIADSCNLAPGSYKKMTHEEIYEIFQESF